MSMSALLEVVVGLIVLFWLASSLCSFMVEALWSTAFNVRAKALQRFVCEMVLGSDRLRHLDGGFMRWRAGDLDGSPRADPLGLLTHPLIASLRKPALSRIGRSTAPSYIPPETFATVLLIRLAEVRPALRCGAVLARALRASQRRIPSSLQQRLCGGADPMQALCAWAAQARTDCRLRAIARLLRTSSAKHGARANRIADALEAVAAALADDRTPGSPPPDAGTLWVLFARAWTKGAPPRASIGAWACHVVQHAPLPAALRAALLPLLATTTGHDAAREAVANWYRDVMDRATGWFKRQTTFALGVCGFTLAVAFNVNPIWLARDLAADPALRKAVITLGDQIVDGGAERAALAQRALFVRAADGRKWWERASHLVTNDNAFERDLQLRALAFEMAPLLVTAPGFVGPAMSALAGSLRRHGEDWGDDAKRFFAVLCRAHVQATRPDDAPVVGATINGRGGDVRNVDACSDLLKPFETADDVYDTLWRHRMVIWDPDLGEVVRAVHRGFASEDSLAAAQRLAGRIDHTLNQARRADASLHDLWSRLPSLGNHRAVLGNVGDAVVTLVGWVLMGVAVSLGAPFWYELLSKITNRRGTGPRPDGAHGDG